MTVNVICMKWGTKYGPEYVNKLYSMVQKHLTLDHRFICLTDDRSGVNEAVEFFDIPAFDCPPANAVSPWMKLTMFSKELGDIKGKTLFLDVDIVIVDNIDALFDYSDHFTIIENWTQAGRGIGNSSVYCFEFGRYPYVLDDYNQRMDEVLATYDNEQIFLSKCIAKTEGRAIDFWPAQWCKSFKRHCIPKGILCWFKTPKIPKGTKIVVFHGDPKPSDAIIGSYPNKWYRHVRPTAWVADNWK